jgi:hypothetical protein
MVHCLTTNVVKKHQMHCFGGLIGLRWGHQTFLHVRQMPWAWRIWRENCSIMRAHLEHLLHHAPHGLRGRRKKCSIYDPWIVIYIQRKSVRPSFHPLRRPQTVALKCWMPNMSTHCCRLRNSAWLMTVLFCTNVTKPLYVPVHCTAQNNIFNSLKNEAIDYMIILGLNFNLKEHWSTMDNVSYNFYQFMRTESWHQIVSIKLKSIIKSTWNSNLIGIEHLPCQTYIMHIGKDHFVG